MLGLSLGMGLALRPMLEAFAMSLDTGGLGANIDSSCTSGSFAHA